MGNVLASSKELISSKNDIPGPTTELTQKLEETILENPGTIEDLHKKCKDVMPTLFEGGKIMLNKGLSNHFQISHTINLCMTNPSSYRFGATYVGTKQFSANEAFPVMLGDVDPSGNLNANIIHQFTPQIRCKIASQVQQNKMTAAQITTDYKGNDFTASLTLGNPNLLNNSGVLVAHYLQSVTEKLALGGELAYQYGPNVPGGQIAVFASSARYANGLSTWSGTFGSAGIHLCYYQKASEQVQIGVEVETSFRLQESVAMIGYQIDIPKSDFIFRGVIDSNWNIGSVMEKKLQPFPFSFALSGRINHTKNQFRLGCGLIIG